eukprot:14547738-Alexandrium_andersonii.AAC.1
MSIPSRPRPLAKRAPRPFWQGRPGSWAKPPRRPDPGRGKATTASGTTEQHCDLGAGRGSLSRAAARCQGEPRR